MTKRLSDQEKIDVVAMYSTGKHNCSSISEKFGVSVNSISRLLKRRGVKVCADQSKIFKRNRYSINESYFDVIDTEEKSYFLGLLYADGCNQDNHVVSIGLQEQDSEILMAFNKALGSNRPIYLKKKGKENWQNTRVLTFSNKRISDNLTKLGCVPRKTLNLKFPTEDQVPEYLQRHFIRGYFDGDGSINYYVDKKGYLNYSASMVGTKEFCEKVSVIVKDIGCNCCSFKPKPSNTVYMTMTRPLLFIGWLYEDCNIFLRRKFDKYTEIVSLSKIRKTRKDAGKYSYLGETKSLKEWADTDICSVGPSIILARMKKGWSFEKALCTPNYYKNRSKKYKKRVK